MKIRMTKNWMGFKAGDVKDLAAGVAECLVNRSRKAVYVTDEESSSGATSVPRRRGRPKKKG